MNNINGRHAYAQRFSIKSHNAFSEARVVFNLSACSHTQAQGTATDTETATDTNADTGTATATDTDTDTGTDNKQQTQGQARVLAHKMRMCMLTEAHARMGFA